MKRLSLFLILITLIFGCAKNPAKAGLLSDFEEVKVWDISPEQGFTLSLSNENITEGSHSLKVVYPISKYPSINTRKLNHNWGEYDYFCFDVFNPQEERISFVIRLDDNSKHKVNIDHPLKRGWNNVKIKRESIAAKINPSNISFIVLFLHNPNKEITLYFDNMRLEKGQKGQDITNTTNKPVRPFISKEIFEPVTLKSALPSQGEMKVYVANLSSPKKQEVLVSSGIPFAPGQLNSETNFAVFDLEGKEIPIAVKVLARWPYDNSIRSLLVQFPLEIEHKYKQVFVKWGIPKAAEDRKTVDVTWTLPEGFVVLPAKWLCLSGILGDLVPAGENTFSGYYMNIEKYYPKMRDTLWKGDASEDSYYDTAHVFYQLYVQSGDDDYFNAARREALHYRDEIIMDGPERGRHTAYGKTRYIYVEAMIDDYLLTGDRKSLTVAGYMAEYLKNHFNPTEAFYEKTATRFWTEREVAFPFLGIISYYELTGDKEYLMAAQQIMQNLYRTQNEWPERGGFIHNLYSHDPEEGARKDEYGGSPFMTGLLLEAIVKYHQLTNSNIAKDSIFKALDWLMNEGLAPDGKSFVYMTSDKAKDRGHPDLNLLIAHAFGYGYKISGNKRTDYLEVGKKIFEYGVNEAYLADRKHFNQNYRSSGHFLAYINKGGEIASSLSSSQ